MKFIVRGPTNPIQDTIYLPSSKSISNRMLIIRSLAGSGMVPENLSDSDDTRVLVNALTNTCSIKDVGHAGTAMRFLTAYYTTQEKEVILTGSERMKQRPIGPLVNALRALGGKIDYLGSEGCPPLRIIGGSVQGGKINIDGSISSQFISALMMIGPVLQGGLQIHLTGHVVSSSYLQMTLALMNQFGAGAHMSGPEVHIPGEGYCLRQLSVESDWSAASYWFQVVAFSRDSKLRLPHLTSESLQGDAVLIKFFAPLGIQTVFKGDEMLLQAKDLKIPENVRYDFTGCPDLVQTCAATLCGLGVPFHFTGTQTLRIKETDRITALQNELGKLGYVLESDADGHWISWEGKRCEPKTEPVISTYHDHRMAMAFAPLALRFKRMVIDDPMVVTKSYPRFWEDLKKAGFKITTG